ncbi:hypothetical protein BGZ46_005696, partial [Entomortierella lignicola]
TTDFVMLAVVPPFIPLNFVTVPVRPDNTIDEEQYQRLLQDAESIYNSNKRIVMDLRSLPLSLPHLALEQLRTSDNLPVTEDIRADYLQEGNRSLISRCKYVDDQRSFLRDLQKRFAPATPVTHAGTEPAAIPAVTESSASNAKILSFPKDLAKFNEIEHCNAQD